MALKKLRGFFFGKTEIEKADEMLQLYMKHLPKLKKLMNEGNIFAPEEEIEKQLYDFFQNYGGTVIENDAPWNQGPLTFDTNGSIAIPFDKRETAKPIDVLNQLDIIPTPFTVENIDGKIKLFKDKSTLTNQRYTRDQIEGFISRLENRKKYREHYSFFNKFPNTNDEKIDALLAKYKLVMKKSHLFVPTFPQDAIDIMKEYSEAVKKITSEKPVFYVIAEEKDFNKKEKKLDPILLVQSPFGFYWQILGAWDKEMLLLHEL